MATSVVHYVGQTSCCLGSEPIGPLNTVPNCIPYSLLPDAVNHISSQLPDPPPRPWALVLTWSLDCDLELPTASTLGEHLEVSHFFDTHTLGLQAPPRGPAGVGVTGWEEEER